MFEMESKFALNVNSKVCSLRTQMQSLHRFLTELRIYGFNFHFSAPLNSSPAPALMENEIKSKWEYFHSTGLNLLSRFVHIQYSVQPS